MNISGYGKLMANVKIELDKCISDIFFEIDKCYSCLGKVYKEFYPINDTNRVQAFIVTTPFCNDQKDEIDDENELIGDFFMQFFSKYIQVNCSIGMSPGGDNIVKIASKKIDFAKFHNPEKDIIEIVHSTCNMMKEGFLNLVPKIGGNLFEWLKKARDSSNRYFYDTAIKLMNEKNYQEAIQVYRHILKEQLAMTDDDWNNYADCVKELGLTDEYNKAVARVARHS